MFDVHLAGYLVLASDFSSLGLDRPLLLLRLHWPLQGDLAILRDDLDIVGVGGEGFVVHDGLSYLLGNVSIRPIFFLLISGGLIRASIPFVDFGIVVLEALARAPVLAHG